MLLSRGASAVGFGDLRELPESGRQGYPVGIVIAVALDRQTIREIRTGPTAKYFAEYTRVNALLDELSAAAVAMLQEKGFRAVAQKATVGADMDRQTLTSALPHKTVATRAGLGWIGKTALLITEPFGSALRLTSVLTDAPLPTGEAIDESRCGECELCATNCPAQASLKASWVAGMPRDEIYNAFACMKKARELSALVGVNQSICGICISVCPWTNRYLNS
jgi:epoxyqueuosine reductase